VRDIIEARLKDLKDTWALSTGDNPDDYDLSEDDWALGLGDDDAHEIVLLIDFIKADDAARFKAVENLDVRAGLRRAGMLLDEAVASLDDENEGGFKRALRDLNTVANNLHTFAKGM
jgi:hypothetical protein